jgi:hypothetical protein
VGANPVSTYRLDLTHAPSTTIFTIVFVLFIDQDQRKLIHDDLGWLLVWILIFVLHWLEYGISLPYLAPAITITLAVICNIVANALCQGHRKSRLIGGSSIEHMLVAVPAKNGRYGYTWQTLWIVLPTLACFGFAAGVVYSSSVALYDGLGDDLFRGE